MPALYNEIDPFAAAWLKNLAGAGHISPGDVDDRSIKDLVAADLTERVQCHFFAGIGVWSHSLRRAGWPDDVPVWTGSCPCQPFSAAGRGGGFDDERHLWPVWFALIEQCRPPVIFGEQVASPAGLKWLDVVRADLEAAGYAFAVFDLCAASVGAPHIRQRLYFVGIADLQRRERIGVRLRERRSQQHLLEARRGSTTGRVGDSMRAQLDRPVRDGDERGHARLADASVLERLDNASRSRGGRDTGAIPRAQREGDRERQLFGHVVNLAEPSGYVGGFWRDAEWVLCRDGKARPIEPGTFPLANGAAARVGRLHAYGNAIVAPLAQVFIEAVIEILIA